jgi:hypothetical protein
VGKRERGVAAGLVIRDVIELVRLSPPGSCNLGQEPEIAKLRGLRDVVVQANLRIRDTLGNAEPLAQQQSFFR